MSTQRSGHAQGLREGTGPAQAHPQLGWAEVKSSRGEGSGTFQARTQVDCRAPTPRKPLPSTAAQPGAALCPAVPTVV